MKDGERNSESEGLDWGSQKGKSGGRVGCGEELGGCQELGCGYTKSRCLFMRSEKGGSGRQLEHTSDLEEMLRLDIHIWESSAYKWYCDTC